jgi:hypothetical protein
VTKRVTKQTLIFVVVALLAAPAWGTECPSELKPTDDYKMLSEKIKCLNDRINELDGRYRELDKRLSGGSSSAAAPAANSAAPQGASAETEWNDFHLIGKSCKDTGKSLVCKVTFTAPNNTSLAVFLDESSLFDQDGGRTSLSEVNFGRKLTPIGHSTQNYIKLDLSKAVAATPEFEFKKTGSDVQTVSAISFLIHDLSKESNPYKTWDTDAVVVKDLPIVK